MAAVGWGWADSLVLAKCEGEGEWHSDAGRQDGGLRGMWCTKSMHDHTAEGPVVSCGGADA